MWVRGAVLTLFLTTALAFRPAPAQAAENADWTCWYPGGHQINCVLVQAASAVGDALISVEPVQTTGGRELPKTVTQVQAGTADLYGQVVRIPLMSEPDDPVLVQQLARFTVCGGALTCNMTFTRDLEEIVLLQEHDPVLQ